MLFFIRYKQPLVRTIEQIGTAENFNVMTFIPFKDKPQKYTISLDKEELEANANLRNALFKGIPFCSQDDITQFKPTDDYLIEETMNNMTITATFSPLKKEKEEVLRTYTEK